MLIEYVKDNYYAGFMILAIMGNTEKDTLEFYLT